MSNNNTEMMVNTRTTQMSTVPTVESLHETVNGFTSALEGINQRLNDIMQQQNLFQQELARSRSGEGPSHGMNGGAQTPRNGGHNGGQNGGQQMMQYGRMSKIEFPKFDGGDVKGWIFRCRQFFRIDNVPEEMKVEMTSMHVYDRALLWHEQFIKRFGEGSPWNLYEQEVLKRFGAAYEDPMVELKNLKQVGSVQA